MFPTNGKLKRFVPPGVRDNFEFPAEDAWDFLTRFAKDVPNFTQINDQVRLTLEAIRGSVQADAVFWYAGTLENTVSAIGEPALQAAWCRAFTERLLDESPGIENQLLRSSLSAPPDRSQPAPRSAAMVQVSRSNRIWIVALSFDPRRLFRCVDMKIMGLARQIFLNQLKRTRLYSRMSETLFWLVQCLTATIDAKIPDSEAHSERVGQIAVRLGQQMRLPSLVVSDIYFAGLLHDIGKTGVSDNLLLKPGKLTPEEFAKIQEYPVIGDRMLSSIKQLSHLRPAVRNHRERFDGKGYPDHLVGDEIPMMARILAVADACDAMLSPRPYRPSLPVSRVNSILGDGAGNMWDPVVVEHFMACRSDIYSICNNGGREAVSPAFNQVMAAWNTSTSRNLPGCGVAAADNKTCSA